MKTEIDWALGPDVRVRDATHNGGEWTLETVRVGPSRCHLPSSDSGFDTDPRSHRERTALSRMVERDRMIAGRP
jgi:hypothetical protein